MKRPCSRADVLALDRALDHLAHSLSQIRECFEPFLSSRTQKELRRTPDGEMQAKTENSLLTSYWSESTISS